MYANETLYFINMHQPHINRKYYIKMIHYWYHFLWCHRSGLGRPWSVLYIFWILPSFREPDSPATFCISSPTDMNYLQNFRKQRKKTLETRFFSTNIMKRSFLVQLGWPIAYTFLCLQITLFQLTLSLSMDSNIC